MRVRPTRTGLRLLLGILGVLVCGALLLWPPWRTSPETVLQQAKRALARQDWPAAERLGTQLGTHYSLPEGWLLAAEAAERQGQATTAVEYLAHVPPANSTLSLRALQYRGELLLHTLHRPAAAEDCFLNVLKLAPAAPDAKQHLGFLMGLQGRSTEAISYRLAPIREGQYELMPLLLLALAETAQENLPLLQEMAQAHPDDWGVLLGQARQAIVENRLPAAHKLLEQVLELKPEQPSAVAWMGQVLVAQQRAAEFAKWNQTLPESAADSPEVWLARGQRALQLADSPGAARCFWESLRRNPNQSSANFQLGQLLKQLERHDLAETCLTRARWLADLIVAAKTYQVSSNPAEWERCADLCERLGLYWEATGWYELLTQHYAQQRDFAPLLRRAQQRRDRLRKALAEAPPPGRQVDELVTVFQFDLSNYPVPKFASPETSAPPDALVAGGLSAHFVDRAADWGFQFRYRNGSRTEQAHDYMYEFSGGGLAALDYDLDRWPDLYCAQGSDWPALPTQREHLDALYRNQSGKALQNVTLAARIIEPSFSQGATFGDINQDGFPDIYVANIGLNRLWLNQGDGTFLDVTASTESAGGDLWSTSVAIADFNGDQLPDIISINYVQGDQLFDRPCRRPDGSTRLCTPHEFDAAPDQLFLNQGDGTFRLAPPEAGLDLPQGKGLGLVVGDLDDSRKLSMFIANDTVPNFFLSNQTTSPTDLRFADQGFLAGLAVDAEGLPQACMGIAAGDLDGQRGLDLFVTNFLSESNTLYLQTAPGSFTDDTRRAGLREPSFDMLGFGTQAVDYDLDGREDLVVANGHIGDLQASGIPYEMPAQLFHNQGGGRFAEVGDQQAGPFFAKPRLGRCLVRGDWNRDGRPDFCVLDLTQPSNLVLNETSQTGHVLAIELRSPRSERDAIGTWVGVTAGGQTRWQQLTTGDGYFGCNQRQLLFGLGPDEQATAVEVRWISGQTETVQNLAGDRVWLFREGTAPREMEQLQQP